MSMKNTRNAFDCIGVDTDKFSAYFLLLGIIIQVITYVVTDDGKLSLASGVAGVISVVLCSQRKLWFYFWSFIQIATFVIICYQQRLYGKLLENAVYIITMIYGLYEWYKHLDNDIVQTRNLDAKNLYYCVFQSICGIIVLHTVLNIVGGNATWLDSVTTTLALVAQVLMIFRFKENWYFWLITDVACVVLWIQQDNYCMVMQYVFWIINCIYGIHKWR